MKVWAANPRRAVGEIERTNGDNWFADGFVLREYSGRWMRTATVALGAFRSKAEARAAVLAHAEGLQPLGRIPAEFLYGGPVVGQSGEAER